MEETSNFNKIFTILTITIPSIIGTIAIFLNLLAIIPRLEVRYWFFWWNRNKVNFRKLKVKKEYQKKIKKVFILKSSENFFIYQTAGEIDVLNKKEKKNFLPTPEEIIDFQRPTNTIKKIEKKVKNVLSENSFFYGFEVPDLGLNGNETLYYVVGKTDILSEKGNHKYQVFFKSTDRFDSFSRGLQIQSLMFDKEWNKLLSK